jgi:hypothetical protein
MILGLQIIALVFALIMIYFAYLHYRRGEINGFEMLFWLIAWIGASVIVIFPEIFRVFSNTIAISRAFDLAVLGGFVLVIPLVYLSYVRTKKIEKKIEDFIRAESLKSLKTDPKRNKK